MACFYSILATAGTGFISDGRTMEVVADGDDNNKKVIATHLVLAIFICSERNSQPPGQCFSMM